MLNVASVGPRVGDQLTLKYYQVNTAFSFFFLTFTDSYFLIFNFTFDFYLSFYHEYLQLLVYISEVRLEQTGFDLTN